MAFANANLQKWFLRQIKLIDEHVAEAKTAHGDEGNDHPNTLILRSGAPSAAPRSRSRGRTIQFRPTEDDDEGHLQLEDEEDEDESYWKASKFRPQKSNPVFVLSFAQILAATRSFQSSIGKLVTCVQFKRIWLTNQSFLSHALRSHGAVYAINLIPSSLLTGVRNIPE